MKIVVYIKILRIIDYILEYYVLRNFINLSFINQSLFDRYNIQ